MPDDDMVVCCGCGCPTPGDEVHDDHEDGCPRKGNPDSDAICWCARPCCPTCCTSCADARNSLHRQA